MALNIERLAVTRDVYAKNLLREAYNIAWDNSKDNKTKTGAIITLDIVDNDITSKYNYLTNGFEILSARDKIIISGYNHLTTGIENLPEWNERPLKYRGMVHSEVDAITKAAKQGIKLEDKIMVMPWLPCTPCYLVMENAGIKKLIAHKDMIEKSSPHWEEDLNMMLYLAEKGSFNIVLYEGKIGGVKSLFNGEVWEP